MTTYSMIAWDTGSQQDVMWTTTDYSAIPLSTETSPNYTGTLVEICILDDEGDTGIAVLTTTDWNLAISTGFYTCADTCSNAPKAQPLFGEVFVLSNGDIRQTVYFSNVIYRQEWVRHKYSGTWSNWTEISEQIEVSDWNNALDNGHYYCGANTTNAPTTGSYLGTVVSKRYAYDGVLYDVSQTLEDISGATRKVWNRFKLSAGAWSAWIEQATSIAAQQELLTPILVNLEDLNTSHYEAVVVEGFNDDIPYINSANLVPNFVCTANGDLTYARNSNAA